MSLSAARSIALSALLTAQTRISVTSSNIANADTDGYTRKVATQTATVTAGIGTGVTVSSITSKVSKLLLASLVETDSGLGAATVTEEYTSLLQNLYGTTSSSDDTTTGTSIANAIADLSSALTSLADTPDSETLQAQVVESLDTLAAQLRSTSSGIQDLRANADADIDSSVDEINQALSDIDSYNEQIVTAQASGAATGDLEDQRNTALENLATLMNVTWFTNSDNEVQVYTSGGQPLVDSSAHEVSYSSASTVTSATTYSATPPSGFSGITVDGVDVTSQITSGKVGGLITLRDDTLPAAQSDLDNLAVELADALNEVHNQGTALPAPSSLTGTTELSSTDTLSATGTVRFAAVDSDGNLVSYADLDLSSYSTVGDLVSAIDGISGLSASLDSSGHLVVSADDSSNGVAVNEMDSSVGTDAQGLSDWLGLNDLVTATSASNFSVRSDILSNTSLLAVSTLSSSSSPTTGSSVLSSGSSTVSSALLDVFEENHTFGAAGNLGSAKTTFANYASEVVGAVSTTYSNAEDELTTATSLQSSASDALSSEAGVNVDEETNLLSELQNMYEAAAQIVSVLNQLFSTLIDMVQSG